MKKINNRKTSPNLYFEAVSRNVVNLIIPFILFNFLVDPLKTFGQPGVLDPLFGLNGIVVTKIKEVEETSSAFLIQPDQKIVLAGLSIQYESEIVVIRYLQDGSIDTSFHSSGYLIVNMPDSTISSQAGAIAIQSDGKIIVAGFVTYHNIGPSEERIFVIRLNPNGTFDNSFGNNGRLILNSNNKERANSILIQHDGKILIGGRSNFNILVLRLNMDGSIDHTYGNNGFFKFGDSTTYSYISSLAFQSDNKIIAGGSLKHYSTYLDYILIKLTISGQIDSSGFGNNGLLYYDSGSQNNSDQVESVLIDSNDNIIVSGLAGCVKYSKTGAMDTLFGENGRINEEILDATQEIDGKLLFTINIPDTFGINLNVNIGRYFSNGKIDSTFGINGITYTDVDQKSDQAFFVKSQLDRKIVGVGDIFIDNNTHFLLVRYLSGLELSTHDFSNNANNILTYPNPISTQTTLQYELASASSVTIRLFDLEGNLISTFLNGALMPQGKQQQSIALPTGLPSGSYLLRVETSAGAATVKLLKQ